MANRTSVGFMRGNNNNHNTLLFISSLCLSISPSLTVLLLSYHLNIRRVHVDEHYHPFHSLSIHFPDSFEESK